MDISHLNKEKSGLAILSHFSLKIIAVILMTLDHVAFFLIDETSLAYLVLRILGRLAFPLFAFMSIQGVFKSHNGLLYAIKLLAVGIVIDLVMAFSFNGQFYTGNSLTELGLGVLGFSLIKRKDKLSFLCIPCFALMILSDFSFFPIRIEYGTLGLFIMGGFYLSEVISEYYFKASSEKCGFDIKEYYGPNKVQMHKNIFSSFFLIAIYLIFFMFWRFYPNWAIFSNFFSFQIEQYGILASVLILFYSGKQGYKNKYVNYGFYLYYPLHLIILALIYFFTN